MLNQAALKKGTKNPRCPPFDRWRTWPRDERKSNEIQKIRALILYITFSTRTVGNQCARRKGCER